MSGAFGLRPSAARLAPNAVGVGTVSAAVARSELSGAELERFGLVDMLSFGGGPLPMLKLAADLTVPRTLWFYDVRAETSDPPVMGSVFFDDAAPEWEQAVHDLQLLPLFVPEDLEQFLTGDRRAFERTIMGSAPLVIRATEHGVGTSGPDNR